MVYVKAKQPRRVTILVYQLDDQDGGDERVGGRGYGGQQREPIAQLTRTMRNTKWQRLLLPTSIIQKAIDSPERVVRMRIVCENCDDATETITAVKVSVGRKQKTREGNRKNQRPEVGKSVRKLRNNKRRPYLVVKTMMAEWSLQFRIPHRARGKTTAPVRAQPRKNRWSQRRWIIGAYVFVEIETFSFRNLIILFIL